MIQYYADLTRWEMERIDRVNTVVMIPLGAVEQHGSQAPLGTDALIAGAMPEYIRKELEKADPDYPMLIFPVMPVGFSVEHMKFCGSISFKPDTYYHVLYDIVESLAKHGFRKIVFLVCHGGNRPVVDTLARQARADLGVLPFVLSSGAFSHPDVQATVSAGNPFDFHGGEMETSMVMAIRPEAVKLGLSEPGYKGTYEGKKAVRFSGEHALCWMGEDFKTADGRPIGIAGDPRGATAEKGSIILETSARELVPALLEIRDWAV